MRTGPKNVIAGGVLTLVWAGLAALDYTQHGAFVWLPEAAWVTGGAFLVAVTGYNVNWPKLLAAIKQRANRGKN